MLKSQEVFPIDDANDDVWDFPPLRMFCLLSAPSCQRHSACRQQRLSCGYHHRHFNEQSVYETVEEHGELSWRATESTAGRCVCCPSTGITSAASL
jgi:hypothetical protein